MPYQVFAERPGALAVMIVWSRLAVARSGSCIAAIASSAALSPSALSLLVRSSAFSSLARSFIAAFSSSVNPLDVLAVLLSLFMDAPYFYCIAFDYCLLFYCNVEWEGDEITTER